ncbi:MAG: ADP-ribosylglycohydrolase family protein [Marinagarivorans sp.]
MSSTLITAKERAKAALHLLYLADALSMPVHWFYNPLDIQKAFPGGIKKFEAAPAFHPSSIMALHSTSTGGRGPQNNTRQPQVVGDIILKGKRSFWGIPNQHYHQGMQAGENTLNAHCARLITRTLIAQKGRYDSQEFLNQYIAFMTAATPQHPDTYAESFHRGFFAQYVKGVPPQKCGLKTHDTPSVGGLVMIGPIAISQLMRAIHLAQVQEMCRAHLWLTHPDEHLAHICDAYVALINLLLFRETTAARDIIAAVASSSIGLHLPKLSLRNLTDAEVVGGMFSKACYIDDAWPSLLFLLYQYLDKPQQGLLANTNLGGENCHRGSVLGVLLGLATADGWDEQFAQLVDAQAIEQEINHLLAL